MGRLASALLGAIAVTLSVASVGVAASPPAGTLVPAQISRTWVKWDPATCGYSIVPRSQHPAIWKATIGKAKPGTLIGFGEQAENNAFAQAVNISMQSASKQAGASLFSVNYNYPDAAAPVTQSQALVSKKPDIIVNFDAIGATLPTVAKLFAGACIPDVQITFPVSGSPRLPVFGASNEVAGQMAGKYLARYVKKKGWAPGSITLVGPTVPGLGSVNKRVTSCATAFKKALPQSQYQEVSMGTSIATGQAAMTDWLTAHPATGSATYVVSCTIADIWSIAVANAVQSAGRGATAAIVGQGASLDGVKAIRSGNGPIVGSIYYDAGRYGDYLVPLALDILAGKAVPLYTHQKMLVVNAGNAKKFYKGQ